jgi:predicted GNAT superfamily acetyltransferase
MASSATEKPGIAIRDIESISEMREVESLQQAAWRFDDRDIVPLAMLVATREVGAILVGAFDGPSLIGFAYSFVGREDEHLVHHSHMLAVMPSHRNLNLGYRLKLAQRERALAQGINRMTWTFDPLQSLNAHFNFAKLGVLADAYKINFYGETTSSFLHQIGTGTDRLWVTWLLDSRRVDERLQTTGKAFMVDRDHIACLVRVGLDSAPKKTGWSEDFCHEQLLIEIPSDINSLQHNNPELGARWRAATNEAFTEAIAAGYLVEDFYRAKRDDRSIGIYLLSYRKKIGDFA